MAIKLAIYEPPAKGLPFLVVSIDRGTAQAFPAKSRGEAEHLLDDYKPIAAQADRLRTKYSKTKS